jgi:hypothetical protein
MKHTNRQLIGLNRPPSTRPMKEPDSAETNYLR